MSLMLSGSNIFFPSSFVSPSETQIQTGSEISANVHYAHHTQSPSVFWRFLCVLFFLCRHSSLHFHCDMCSGLRVGCFLALHSHLTPHLYLLYSYAMYKQQSSRIINIAVEEHSWLMWSLSQQHLTTRHPFKKNKKINPFILRIEIFFFSLDLGFKIFISDYMHIYCMCVCVSTIS